MSDDLIEKIARAIARADGDSDDNWEHWLIDASAALSAIEKSGTHVVVPTDKPTADEMVKALAAVNYRYFGDYPLSESQWDAVSTMMVATRVMLSARPPIGGETNE